MATADRGGAPNVAPKFLLETRRNVIFLVDYPPSKTWENVRVNPRVSLAIVDTTTLTGYRIDGTAAIVDKGPAYERGLKELKEREVHCTATRMIEGIHLGKRPPTFEIAFPERVAIYRITVRMVTEIGPSGTLTVEQA